MSRNAAGLHSPRHSGLSQPSILMNTRRQAVETRKKHAGAGLQIVKCNQVYQVLRNYKLHMTDVALK